MEQDEKKKQGYRIWKNKGNGFTCMSLHYTADPSKRSEEWKQKAKYGMDQKTWNTEMELSWETYAGEGVYTKEFNKQFHVAADTMVPDKSNPTLVRGWDFGGNHSCVVTQYIDGQVRVLTEYANVGFNTTRIARDIVEDCNQRYDNYRYIEVIDPSGMWEGKTSTGMACADAMRELGLTIVPGDQDPTRRVKAVMDYMTLLVRGKPGLIINPECKMLIDGFMGGYHYPEKETKNQKRNKPEKNEYSHIHDALQYVCTRVNSIGNAEVDIGIDLADSGYNFEF